MDKPTEWSDAERLRVVASIIKKVYGKVPDGHPVMWAMLQALIVSTESATFLDDNWQQIERDCQ